MEVVHARCCGIDVHKKSVTACVLITEREGTVQKQIRTFPTMLEDLLALSDWLRCLEVTTVAMESTGVYWRPVYNILEGAYTVLLVNAQHVRTVPGRKTDVKDSEWLADLLRHGLLTGSFIPPAPIRELRELTRYRQSLVRERTQEVNRLHKVLESANIKLAAVASDVMGVSGRQMLEALLGGEQDPTVLADLARGRLRQKLPALRQALDGRVQPHHLVLLSRMLAHIDFLEESLAEVGQEIGRAIAPFGEDVALLRTIPGVDEIAAATIIAEIGTDMSRFPSAKHLASWAGVCPGNRESAGKQLGSTTRPGDTWLKAILGEVAWAISHRKRDNYLTAQYHRLARKRGTCKAVVAVMHSVLVIAYHILQDKHPYADLGADYFDTLDRDRLERYYVNRLSRLGYDVTLEPHAA